MPKTGKKGYTPGDTAYVPGSGWESELLAESDIKRGDAHRKIDDSLRDTDRVVKAHLPKKVSKPRRKPTVQPSAPRPRTKY